jgi:hypothetical protein
MVNLSDFVKNENKIKTFRWFFYISLLQSMAYFVVPIFIFPPGYILHIEIISALTLGLVVGLFFLLVNIYGLFLDIGRRPLYVSMLVVIGLWFLWATISWTYIEHMDYLLR